jgi:N-acetyl-gamma-glutamyl-phosphate reductase
VRDFFAVRSEDEMSQPNKVKVAVVGATGYTGAELLRLMHGHPGIEVTTIAGHGKAGQKVATVLPNLHGTFSGDVVSVDPDAIAATAQAAFCGLPHGASAGIVRELRKRGLVVFDLSADFRLKDLAVYKEWYGEHEAPDLLAGAVYGLCELERESIRQADLIAVPGCYPTASALAIAPLVKAGLVELDTLIVDAKSGASGAGRGLSESTHFAQLSEGFRAYKVAGLHRHTPEIEQTLSSLCGKPVRITFTPHLVPMTRGILATVYARVPAELTRERCTELARAMYEGSPSVTVLDPGIDPDTLWVRGSNRCFVSYTIDKRTSRVVAQAVIDNLVKGASGQAIQCFNLRFGFAENTGIAGVGIFP